MVRNVAGVRTWGPALLWSLAMVVLVGGCVAPPASVSPGASGNGGLVVQGTPGEGGHPTLADFWDGRAEFVVEVRDTGLPRGESDTVVMGNGELWSYLHASDRSAGIVDRCGEPVEFPGCTVIYKSTDGGRTFAPPDPPTCLFECAACPCDADVDHVVQQQYPRVHHDGETMYLVYEYLGRVMLRRSADGLAWSAPQQVDETGIWKQWLRSCPFEERIGPHPYVRYDYECLAGGPPGIWVEDGVVYVFLAVGQNPSGMGCYFGPAWADAGKYKPCYYNPLFSGAAEYGPLDASGAAANAYFDFRTISSAEVVKVGGRYYMLYEGVRGPEPGEAGDSQFGLGLARSVDDRIDGPWETYAGNPILVDLPGNIGLGHADLVVIDGQTILYTALERHVRSRLALAWREPFGPMQMTLEEAKEHAQFPLLLPGYVPEDAIPWDVYQFNDSIVIEYFRVIDPPMSPAFVIIQSGGGGEPSDLPMSPLFESREVIVRGQHGLLGIMEGWGSGRLAWIEKGVFIGIAGQLNEEELFKIAETMK